jgi:hypothetical protein
MRHTLDATTSLPDGTRVRLRLPHAADRPELHALHARLGLHADELDVARVLRFDPRRGAVVCATAWTDRGPLVVGYGAIAHGDAHPEVLVADEARAPGLSEVLGDVLRRRAAERPAA